MRSSECVAFLQWALPRMNMRWPGFRRVRGQVCKRLSRRLRELDLQSLDEYRAHLDAHPAEWDVLDGFCRITISRFYRDRGVFDTIRDPILPALGRAALLREDPVIHCWSAGCASGEEPYSLSLAWDLQVAAEVPGADLRIVATDVDIDLLERARAACYPPGALKDLPEEWTALAFERSDQQLCLHPSYRGRVELLRQDIRLEMPPGPFDLVLCRNLVFTYFEASLQAELLHEAAPLRTRLFRPPGSVVEGRRIESLQRRAHRVGPRRPLLLLRWRGSRAAARGYEREDCGEERRDTAHEILPTRSRSSEPLPAPLVPDGLRSHLPGMTG